MKTRWKILSAVMAFLGVFTGIWMMTIHVGPANSVEAYKKALQDKGEKLELSEVVPPPVPASQNAADAAEDAFRLVGSGEVYSPGTMQMIAPGKAMVSWQQPDVRNRDFTNSWEEFTTAMAADRPILDLLAQVLERPQLDFHLEYKKGFAMLLPQLASLKQCAQKLSAATVCDLHNGETDYATTNLCILLALTQASADERTIISQLVRFADIAIAESATWDYLQATNLTDAQLAMVQRSWEQQDLALPAEHAFLMERAITDQTIESMRASHAAFRGVLGSYSGGSSGGGSWPGGMDELMDNLKFATGEVMWRTSWSYSEELHQLQADQIILDTLRTMETNQVLKPGYDAMISQLSSLGLTNTASELFHKLNIPDFSDIFGDMGLTGTVRKMMQMEAARRVVVTAIALKRFQIKHGRFPEKLSDLTPELASSVPIDPYNGLPLQYRPGTNGTYLLYCVGTDGVDNGGDAIVSTGIKNPDFHWQSNNAHDWVWPQPATAAEIEKYYVDEALKTR